MKSRLVVFLLFFILTVLMVTTAVSGQEEEQEVYDVETSDVSDVPFIGIYSIPLLGALRRRRHDINNRSYNSPTENSTESDQVQYIKQ